MIACIDGDSIIYILAWTFKDSRDMSEMNNAIDRYLEDMFTMTGCDQYYGALADDVKCFRYELYKVKPYKATRREPEEHVIFWKPIIVRRLKEIWGFESAPGLEADDLIGSVCAQLAAVNLECVVCSPDKDLRQIEGIHFNYQTGETLEVNKIQSIYNFWYLMLVGDDSDNILGLPGTGPKKATEKLKGFLDPIYDDSAYGIEVLDMYMRHFGPYYGKIVYKETYDTIRLKLDSDYTFKIHSVQHSMAAARISLFD